MESIEELKQLVILKDNTIRLLEEKYRVSSKIIELQSGRIKELENDIEIYKKINNLYEEKEKIYEETIERLKSISEGLMGSMNKTPWFKLFNL
jgi:hypothetical protein